jgi:hypothetical protein
MMYAGQVWPYWLCMLIFALMTLRGRWVLAAAIVALACDIRPTALVPAAAIFTAAWTLTRFTTILLAALTGFFVLGLSSVPFAPHLNDWRLMFVSGPARALEQAHLQGNPANQIALSNIMDRLGLGRFDVVMEAVLGLGTMGLAWIAARRGPGTLLAIAGIGYIATISANPYLHRYYYVAGMLLCAIGLASSKAASADDRVAAPA